MLLNIACYSLIVHYVKQIELAKTKIFRIDALLDSYLANLRAG